MNVLHSSAEKCLDLNSGSNKDASAPVAETNVAQTGSVLTSEEGQAVLTFHLISTMQQMCPWLYKLEQGACLALPMNN